MRRFLYYFPGLPGMNAQMLAQRGVKERFTGPGDRIIEHVITGIDEGPAGSGCIVAAGGQVPSVVPGMTWSQGKTFWVAIEDDLRPRPDDLAREVGIRGYEAVLGDGCSWRIPLIRRWDRDRLEHVSNLPKKLAPSLVGGAYKFQSAVQPQYAAVDAIAHKVFESFAQGKTIPIEQAFADAAALLAVNYRIGLEEAGLLGLLDAPSIVTLLGLSIDMPALNRQAAESMRDGLEYTEPVIRDE